MKVRELTLWSLFVGVVSVITLFCILNPDVNVSFAALIFKYDGSPIGLCLIAVMLVGWRLIGFLKRQP